MLSRASIDGSVLQATTFEVEQNPDIMIDRNFECCGQGLVEQDLRGAITTRLLAGLDRNRLPVRQSFFSRFRFGGI